MKKTTLLAAIALVAVIAMPGGPGLGRFPVTGSGRQGEVHLRCCRGLWLPHRTRESRHGPERRGAEIRCALRHGVLHEHHTGSPNRYRDLDGRTDHCGNPCGSATQRGAYHPDPPVHDVQRDGRRGSPRPGRVLEDSAAHQPAEPTEEDQRAPLRKRVPAGLAGRLRFKGDAAAAGANHAACRAASIWSAWSAIAASAIPRAGSPRPRTTPASWPVTPRGRKIPSSPTSPPTRIPASPGPRRRSPSTWAPATPPAATWPAD